MALQNILGMVRSRLPFLPVSIQIDADIAEFTLEQFYYLQKWTKKTDAEVEDENNYSGLQKMLVAELVCCEFISKKILETVGGSAGADPTQSKRIKKAKADVVEAEFDYGKASDGTFMGMTGEQLFTLHAKKACEYAATLGYSLPMCVEYGYCKPFVAPAFLAFPNCNIK